jgi:hypothetical protein
MAQRQKINTTSKIIDKKGAVPREKLTTGRE